MYEVVLFTTIFLGLFLYQTSRNKYISQYLVVIGVLLVIQSGFRSLEYSYGNDTATYNIWYNGLSSTSFNQIFENLKELNQTYENRDQGFNLLTKFTQIFIFDFRTYLICVALFINIMVLSFFKKMIKSIDSLIVSLVVYEVLIIPFFNAGIRQTIAMGFCMIALRYVISRKLLGVICFVAIAFTIHSSALVFIPIYFLYDAFLHATNYKKIIYKFAVLLSPIFFIIMKFILVFVAIGSIFEKYAIESINNSGTPVFTALIYLISILAFFLFDNVAKNQIYWNIAIPSLIMILILVPLTWIDSNFIRLVFYYIVLIIPAIPSLIDEFALKINSNKSALYILTVCLLLILHYQ